MVEEELKIDVNEDMSAANITASIRPRTPTGKSSLTSFTKATFVQPALGKEKNQSNLKRKQLIQQSKSSKNSQITDKTSQRSMQNQL